jgi:hypothetical protein
MNPSDEIKLIVPAVDETETSLSDSTASHSAFVPIVLLAVSLLLVLFWEVSTLSEQCDVLNQTVEQNQNAVIEAQRMQAGISKLLADLLAAAKDDGDARMLLYKFDIRDPQTGKPLIAVAPAATGSNAQPAAAPAESK